MINDRDARPAWSFTLLHETVHLLLGQTGVSGVYGDSEVERFCNDVAGEFLLPARELDLAALDQNRDFELLSDRVSALADKFKVSRTRGEPTKHFGHSESTRTLSSSLAQRIAKSGLSDNAQARVRARNQEGGPSYYTVRSHRLGGRIVNLVRRMMAADALSTSKAARILGVKSRQVQPLLGVGRLV